MQNFISFNQQIIPAENSFLSAVSNAALYGKGVFTTVAVFHSNPFLWEKHWQRLNENAGKIRINLNDFSESSIKNALLEIIVRNNLERGRARLTFFDETSSAIWQTATESKTNFLIQTAKFRSIPKIFRLTVSPFRVNSTSSLAGVKSCNYLENLLALEAARKENFDEAVRLNERGEIVSACLANLFWTKNRQIYTPSLETGCLQGTTRDWVLENFPVVERAAPLEELKNADEIFITSAGIGIVQANLSS